jgi:hypothetical protein
VRFNKGTIRMLFVTEPNRLKVLAGKILALTTSIAAAIRPNDILSHNGCLQESDPLSEP